MTIDPAFINLSIGLMILIAANIVLGSLNALFESTFNWGQFFKGIAKAAIIAVVMVGVYFAGALNPDIVAVDVGGQSLTVLSAISAVVLGGYFFYAKQVIDKLIIILNANKVKPGDKEEGVDTDIID